MAQRPFAWPDGPSGRRQLVGHSKKRRFYWHYAVSCWAQNAPVPHLRIAGHVIFTSDGQSVTGDAKRLHLARRSFCKSWRNDKWRDLLLAFCHWLSAGAPTIDVPLGEACALKLRLPPIMFDAPFGIETAIDHESITVDEEDEEDENIFDDDGEPADGDEEEQDTGEDP